MSCSINPQNNRDLNQGLLHLWSKFGDPSWNGSWVIARTSSWLTHGRTHTQTDAGNDNTRRPILALGKKQLIKCWYWLFNKKLSWAHNYKADKQFVSANPMVSCHFSRSKYYIELNWSILFNLVITTLMECLPASSEQKTTNQDKIFHRFSTDYKSWQWKWCGNKFMGPTWLCFQEYLKLEVQLFNRTFRCGLVNVAFRCNTRVLLQSVFYCLVQVRYNNYFHCFMWDTTAYVLPSIVV